MHLQKKKKKILPTNLLTKVLVGAIFMLSSCSNWLEPGATSPYFSSVKEWHDPQPLLHCEKNPVAFYRLSWNMDNCMVLD